MDEFVRADFDKKIDKVQELFEYFKKCPQKNNLYEIYLANGDFIRYRFNINNIPHLLGVDFTKLQSLKLINGKTSEDKLLSLIENKYSVGKAIINKSLYENEIFSRYFEDKVNNFKKILEIPDANNIKFICKYDREVNYKIKDIDGITGDYIIATENDNNDLVMFVLKKPDENNNYINDYVSPQSIRVLKDYENDMSKLAEIINKQVVTYSTGIVISNDYVGFSEKNAPRIAHISRILNYLTDLSENTGCIPCTIKGHKFNLKGLSNNKLQGYNDIDIDKNIVNCINNHSLIEFNNNEEEQIKPGELLLINNYNDNLVNENEKAKNKYSEIMNKYHEAIDNNSTLIEELKALKDELEALKNDNQKKDETINELNNYKNDYFRVSDEVNALCKTLIKRNN